MAGKIIAIVGAPRSGKSFLARKLAHHFNAPVFLEGEEGEFPARIEEDIAQNIRPLERALWFRTTLVERYLKALELRDKGHTVILDVFWVSPHMYIDTLLKGFERDLIWNVARQDERLLGWPDLTIFLKVSEHSIRSFIQKGGRAFDNSEEYIVTQALPVNKAHSDYFKKRITERVLTIERDELDFELATDFETLIMRIREHLDV
jgi:deoxyadenosine/deoxycytidine kinase